MRSHARVSSLLISGPAGRRRHRSNPLHYGQVSLYNYTGLPIPPSGGCGHAPVADPKSPGRVFYSPPMYSAPAGKPRVTKLILTEYNSLKRIAGSWAWSKMHVNIEATAFHWMRGPVAGSGNGSPLCCRSPISLTSFHPVFWLLAFCNLSACTYPRSRVGLPQPMSASTTYLLVHEAVSGFSTTPGFQEFICSPEKASFSVDL